MRFRRPLATTLAAALAVIALVPAPRASAQGRAIDAQRSTITIHVFKSGLLRAFADDHLIRASVADGSVDDAPASKVDVVVDARRLRVLDPDLSTKDREQVQARMLGPEVLDSNRFTRIRFQSTAVRPLAADRWLVRGELELHGRMREVALTVIRKEGHYTGRTTLRQTDFGISPISIAGGTVKVKDEISIDFDIVTTERGQ